MDATRLDVNGLALRRAELRQKWLMQLMYTSMAVLDQQDPNNPLSRAEPCDRYVLNFMAGVHMPIGARFIRDLFRDSLELLLVKFNAVVHACRMKKFGRAPPRPRAPKGAAPAAVAAAAVPPDEPDYRPYVAMEYLHNSDSTAFIGFRVFIFLVRRSAAALAPPPAPAAQQAPSLHSADTVDGDSADADDPEDSVAQAPLLPPQAAAGTAVCALSKGMLGNCDEAVAVRVLLQKAEAKKKKKAGAAPAPPQHYASFMWTNATVLSQVYFGTMRKYFDLGRTAVVRVEEMAAAQPGCMLDPRPCMRASASGMRWVNQGERHKFPYDTVNALNAVFTLEAAMVYHTRNVLLKQRDLSSYEPERVQYDDDSDLLTRRALSGTTRIAWPCASTTYLINSLVYLPEVLAMMPLAHVIGVPPPNAAEMTLGIHERMPNEALLTLCTSLLASIENAATPPSAAMSYDVGETARARMNMQDRVQIIAEQRSVVEAAMGRENSEAAGCKYQALLNTLDMTPSTNGQMGTMDFIPAEYFSRNSMFGNGGAWQQAVLRHFRNVQPGGGGNAAALDEVEMRATVSRVAQYVDDLDADLAARDDLLRARTSNQVRMGTLKIEMENRLLQMHKEHASQAELNTVAAEYAHSVWETRKQMAAEFDTIFRSSDNLPDVLKSAATRGFFTEHFNEAGWRASLGGAAGGRPVQIMNERPLTQYMQQHLNDPIRGIKLATTQSYAVARLAFFCSLDAHTWTVYRGQPATNLLLAGDTGIGKSWVLKLVEHLSVPGVLMNVAHMTSKALQTETNFDNLVFGFEESRSGVLFANNGNPADKGTGSSDTLNLEKNRLTNFYSLTTTPFTDDATGKRTTITSKSSQHNMTILCTNQFLKEMDKNMDRRYIVYFMPRNIGSGEGSDTIDLAAVDAFTNQETSRALHMRHRLVNGLYMWASGMIKAAVIPDMTTWAADVHVDAVIKELLVVGKVRIKDAATRRHFVLQVARNIALHQACWETLYGPLAWEVYRASLPAAPAAAQQQERRTYTAEELEDLPPGLLDDDEYDALFDEAMAHDDMIIEPPPVATAPVPVASATATAKPCSPEWALMVTTPFMVVMKEHIVQAFTMLEHLFTPFYTEYTLRILAVCCLHFDNVEKWYYRVVASHIPNEDALIDCNYLCMYGRDVHDICRFIQENNKEFELRAEDIEKILLTLGEQRLFCEALVCPELAPGDVGGKMASAAPGGEKVARPVLFFEQDNTFGIGPRSSSTRQARGPGTKHRLCVSIKWLEARLKVKMNDSAAIQALLTKWSRIYEEDAVTPPMLEAYTQCDPTRSPLTAALTAVLSHHMHEVDPELAPWLVGADAPTARPFLTDYVPPALTVYTMPAAPQEQQDDEDAVRPTRTIPSHGNHLMMTLQRKEARILSRENYSRLTTTAKRTLEGMRGRRDRTQNYEESKGFVMRVRDIDSTAARDHLLQLGHPGLPVAEQYFYGDDAPLARRPAVLPLAFGPVYTRIYQNIARHHGDDKHYVRYPAQNLEDFVRETLALIKGARAGTYEGYVDLDGLAGEHTICGIDFRRPPQPAEDAMEIEERGT